MNNLVNSLEWFTDRIGKKIFRVKNICPCTICQMVIVHGLIISDKNHAQYLFDIQNELGIEYFEKD
jgi:hypothetical protein